MPKKAIDGFVSAAIQLEKEYIAGGSRFTNVDPKSNKSINDSGN